MKRRRAASRVAACVRGVQEENVDLGSGCMEENVLAMVDSQGVKDADSIQDDKLSFFDAVYEQFILSEQAKPSRNIYKAVYSCLQESQSLEVAMTSYRLLTDLDMAGRNACGAVSLASCLDFEKIAADLMDERPATCRFVPKVLVFEHFVTQMVTDFEFKRGFYSGDDEPEVILVYQQLKMSSSLIAFSDKVLLELLDFVTEEVKENDVNALYYERIYKSLQAFISLIFELDELMRTDRSSRKEYVDALVDRLLLKQNSDKLPLFLRALHEPNQMLKFTLKFLFQQFSSKRKGLDCSCLEGLLGSFNEKNAQAFLKDSKAQLLLAYAYQAFLCCSPCDGSFISRQFIAAFELFQSISRDFTLNPSAKQALIVAELLSKS